MSRSSDAWRRLRCRRGQAAVELAIITPLLLILFLGIFEFGRVFETNQALASLSREGANLAGRGTNLDEAVEATLSNGLDIDLTTRGGVVASRITKEGSTMMIKEQIASPGYGDRSHYGTVNTAAVNLTPGLFVTGQTIYAVEVFYDYTTATPLSGFTSLVFPDELYERTVF